MTNVGVCCPVKPGRPNQFPFVRPFVKREAVPLTGAGVHAA